MNIKQFTLANGKIGIEREMLRTQADGELAHTPHPASLGHVFTHPNITIDYAEALIEVVTDALSDPRTVYQQLLHLHQYCAQNIQNEKLWPASMPCILPSNPDDIEIGYFGQSNSAKIKRLYRKGLGLRYGKSMQMIAGVHFNYSPNPELWQQLADSENKPLTQAFINDKYMSMLRNIQKYGWLICYLFGASPAVDQSFTAAKDVLSHFSERTLGWENATTLRMSKLGYQNKAEFTVSFNTLSEYIKDLITAVTTPSPTFEYLGLKDAKGNYQQISTHLLQIENEYYTAARPKQPTKANEHPSEALYKRGIAYVELRLLDNNPYDPCGISLDQIYFLELFMLWALLKPASLFTHCDYNEVNHNRLGIACCGLKERFLLSDHGAKKEAEEWAKEILAEIKILAIEMDEQVSSTQYTQAMENLFPQNNLRALPQKVHEEIKAQGFINWGLARQKEHEGTLLQALDNETKEKLDQLRDQSLNEFKKIEAEPQINFDQYLHNYFKGLQDIYFE